MIHKQRQYSPLLIISLVLLLVSCDQQPRYNLDNNVGLYKIYAGDCEVNIGAANPCLTSRYLELVKGRFYGIDESELALVFWEGKKTDKVLTYTARKIKDHSRLLLVEDKVVITKTEYEQELIVLKDNQVIEYQLRLQKPQPNGGKTIRNLFFYLRPVERKDLSVSLAYPNAVD